MKLLFSYIRQFRRLLALALGFTIVNQVFSLLDPQIFRLIIDRYASQVSSYDTSSFLRGVGLLLAASVTVAMISRIAKNIQEYCVHVVTQRVGASLYADSIQHVFSLPFFVFEDQQSGAVLEKLQKARTDVQTFIASFVNVFFLSLVGIVFIVTYAFIVHWAIGAVYALSIPLFAGIVLTISKKIRGAQKKIVKETVELSGTTTETLRNVEVVKSLGLEKQEIERLNATNEKILQLELRKVKLVRTLSFIQGTLINALRSAILLLMLVLIFRGSITLGEFFSLWMYSFFLFNPLSELSTVASQFQEMQGSMEALQGILSLPVQRKPSRGARIEKIKSVSFDRVSFSYSSGIDAVHDISFTVKAGQTAAFVGPSGSGKSTIVKLMVGLYVPSRGLIRLNGIDVRDIDMDGVRRTIGLVTQTAQLFAGTIRENLLFVRPDATDDECLRALHDASLDSVLRRAEKGLDTKIGEGGVKLSGGERQRLAIARALLRNPSLLIFDEATSHLDSIVEREITQTIQKIEREYPHRIRVLVAHRLATIVHADVIFVLEKGRLVERGNHATLLEKGGLYAALWRHQQAQGEEDKGIYGKEES